MATICLYANKINGMPDFVNNAKKSVGNLKDELVTLKNKCQAIDSNYCNVDDIIDDISTSTKTQEEKIESLEKLNDNIEQFARDTERIDNEVADIIESRKNDFYDEYTYLKPDCEKSVWEKAKSAFKSVGEWCKEHWKLIATIVIVIAAIVVIVCTGGAAVTVFGTILLGMAKGALIGAALGGLSGGIVNLALGESFFEGFEDGAFSGAISGLITGGVSGTLAAFSRLGRSASALELFKKSNLFKLLDGTNTLKPLLNCKDTLTIGQNVLLAGGSSAGASLLGDSGDIFIKGDSISIGEVMYNAVSSFALGSLTSWAGTKVGGFTPRVDGINKGIGSWQHVWATQLSSTLNNGSKVALKSIVKGMGVEAFETLRDNIVTSGIEFVYKSIEEKVVSAVD